MSPFGGAARLFTTLASAVKQRPLAFNSATGGTLCVGSDALAQQVEEKNGEAEKKNDEGDIISSSFVSPSSSEGGGREFDGRRFLSAGLIGMLVGGLVYPAAYARLDRLWAGVNFASVVKKSLVEIATVGIFVNSISMASRGLLVGRTGDDVAEHVAREMPTVTMNDARVWLPYNMVAFSVVPAFLRPTTTAMMESAWQTYISLRSNDYVEPAKT